MRNLKKVLALVLALAMVMTMFAGAISFAPVEFSDAETLTTDPGKEAGKILSALGVFVGDAETAAIRGTAPISRQEMAKVAMVLKTGSEDETFYTGATTIFTDNNGWGADFVNWAYYNGILSGDGKGLVRPWDNVTGVEAAKIFLTVLGYDAAEYGFINNANWKNNVLTVATRIGLLNNVVGSMDGDLSRENVMIMAANALYLNVNDTNETLLNNVFGYTKITATAVANKDMGLTIKWDTDSASQFDDAWYYINQFDGEATYKKTTGTYARFAYRDYVETNAANGAGYFTYKVITADVATNNTDIGTEYDLLVSDLNDVTYDSYEIRKVIVLGESASAKNTAGNFPTDPDKYAESYVNYFKNDGYKAVAAAPTKMANTAPWVTKDTDNDGYVDYVWYADYTLGLVSAVNEGSVKVSNATAIGDIDTYTTTDEYALGDYVFVWKNLDGTKFIKKLDYHTASIVGWDIKDTAKEDDDTWTLSDGTTIQYGDYTTARAYKFFNDKQWSMNNTVYTFITDGKYVVDVKINTETKFADYAIVTAIAANDIGWDGTSPVIMTMPYVKLFTADNQYKTYSLASVNGVLVNNYVTGNYNNIADVLSADELVSYVVDDTQVHITTIDYGTTEGAVAATSEDASGTYWWNKLTANFDTETNMWLLGSPTSYLADTNSATIFAKTATGSWMAYGMGEFYGVDANCAGNGQIVYNWSGYNTVVVKAMALIVDELPATTLGTNGQIIIANGFSSYTYANGVYTYVVNTIKAENADTDTITFKSYVPVQIDAAGNTLLTKGNVYKLNTNDEGYVINIEEIALDATTGAPDFTKYIQTVAGKIDDLYVDAFGTVTLKVNGKPIALADGAEVYCVENLGKETVKKFNFSTLYAVFNGLVDVDNATYTVSAMYNADGEITTAIICKNINTTPAA